jgi:hypothetical protein
MRHLDKYRYHIYRIGPGAIHLRQISNVSWTQNCCANIKINNRAVNIMKDMTTYVLAKAYETTLRKLTIFDQILMLNLLRTHNKNRAVDIHVSPCTYAENANPQKYTALKAHVVHIQVPVTYSETFIILYYTITITPEKHMYVLCSYSCLSLISTNKITYTVLFRIIYREQTLCCLCPSIFHILTNSITLFNKIQCCSN